MAGVTKKEFDAIIGKVFDAIGKRVKWSVFMLAVAAFGFVIGFAAPKVWETSETAHATEMRFADYKKTQRRENNAIIDQLKALNDKFDKLMERLHE